jgi:hypothetical protein
VDDSHKEGKGDLFAEYYHRMTPVLSRDVSGSHRPKARDDWAWRVLDVDVPE